MKDLYRTRLFWTICDSTGQKNIDISLEVGIIPEGNEETTVCHSNFKYMYWNINQQLAHQTVNGCLVRAGDMYGSGTISAPAEDGYGSMMELTWRGQNPLTMKDGSTRKFIEDGDTVVIRGWCERKWNSCRFWRSQQ